MFHPTIKNIIIFLLIIVVSIIVIFFSRPEEQSIPIFAEKIQQEIDIFDNYGDDIFKEFALGEFFTKRGEFDKAIEHYNNVYFNYPDFHKGYIKWRAYQNIKQIERVLKIIEEEGDNFNSDTDILIEDYFREIKR